MRSCTSRHQRARRRLAVRPRARRSPPGPRGPGAWASPGAAGQPANSASARSGSARRRSAPLTRRQARRAAAAAPRAPAPGLGLGELPLDRLVWRSLHELPERAARVRSSATRGSRRAARRACRCGRARRPSASGRPTGITRQAARRAPCRRVTPAPSDPGGVPPPAPSPMAVLCSALRHRVAQHGQQAAGLAVHPLVEQRRRRSSLGIA